MFKEDGIYLISEIGINHNADMQVVKKLIDATFACGWDCVKFQKRNPEKCVPESQRGVLKDTPWGRMTYLEYKKRMEFSESQYDYIDAYCKEKPLSWTASVWDRDSLDFILKYDVPFIKIPSPMLSKAELVKAIADTGKPIIMSTGMSTVEEIDNSVLILDSYAPNNYALMHCNSTYPASLEDLNLNMIKTLKERYGCTIGYCLDPQTRILTTSLEWKTAEEIDVGTEIIAFPESFSLRNSYCSANILGKQEYIKERFYIETEDGFVICSEGHKWPVLRLNTKEGQFRRKWVAVEDLIIDDTLTFLTKPWEPMTNYRAGYIAGLLDGEGWIQNRRVGFAQNPGPIFDEYEDFIKNEMGITTYHRSIPKSKAWAIDVNGRRQSFRLLGTVRPKRLLINSRKMWEGVRTWHRDSMSPIKKIEKMGKGKVIGLQTSTGTLIANGFLSHNSGHEYGLEPTVIAVALGARIIERHITLDHNMWGTDQAASLEVHAMDLLRKRVVEANICLGDGVKRLTEGEIVKRKQLR